MDAEVLHRAFVEESTPLAAEVEQTLLRIERTAEALQQQWTALLGMLHTIKGNCGMMRYEEAQDLAHAMEECAKESRDESPKRQLRGVARLIAATDALRVAIPEPPAHRDRLRRARQHLAGQEPEPGGRPGEAGETPEASDAYLEEVSQRLPNVRIAADKLDRLLEAVGELASYHSHAASAVHELMQVLSSSDHEAIQKIDAVDRLGTYVTQLRQRVMEVRLLPLSLVFGRFERLVRDLAQGSSKSVRLDLRGAETVVDKSIVDVLGQPLLHIVRNAVAHGIEPPQVRRGIGKPEQGLIWLHAQEVAGNLLVVVGDDGRGLERSRLVAKARELGIDARTWAEEDLFGLIFRNDFSTADQLSAISGRGVGLAAARQAVEEIGGSIYVSSREGRGTEFRLQVPLIVAIRRALLVDCGGELYGLPVAAVAETFRLSREQFKQMDGHILVEWRERLLRVEHLGARLAQPGVGSDWSDSLCVVVQDEHRARGFLIDRLAGQHEVMVKELEPILRRSEDVSGAAILGDGRVIMVLDPKSLTRSDRLHHGPMFAGVS
jgi:two-component system chemotaxis sensor kinase CheA